MAHPAAEAAASARLNLIRILQPGADFGLGPFRVAPERGITMIDPAVPVAFDIVWRGCPVRARLENNGLHLSAILGRVPSSAASGAALRDSVFDVLGKLPAELPSLWNLALLPDHRVQIAWSRPLPPPISVEGLVCNLTEFLLALAPYLDLMEESGITLLPAEATPCATTGTASSWPG